jgi:hypothetical protein
MLKYSSPAAASVFMLIFCLPAIITALGFYTRFSKSSDEKKINGLKRLAIAQIAILFLLAVGVALMTAIMT